MKPKMVQLIDEIALIAAGPSGKTDREIEERVWRYKELRRKLMEFTRIVLSTTQGE